MKETFLQFPAPLRRHILIRAVGCILGIGMMVMLLACRGDWKLLLPCGILSAVCMESAAALFDRCHRKQYIVITGICTDIERTSFRRHIKSLYLRSDGFNIKIVGVGKIRDLNTGDTVAVYLADNTAVYDMDGYQVICTYLALKKIAAGGID